ncbi:MAG: ABC transporter substrate-binding protein [Rhodobacteraceae bacterium]|nr:ABC transporter substrate-binding protein [Paracoccaceae bacterium]MCP5341810.1 ABC transporter substrate-binding protein [Paracoccaceae bacterium]
MIWRTDRRGLLKAGGAAVATLALGPKMAWAAMGDTLRIRMAGDYQVIDPFGEIGELDDIIPRCTTVTLVRVGDMRDGNLLSNYAAEKIGWASPTTIAFTLRDNLTWTNGFGPVTTADVKYSFERIAGSDSAWAYQFDQLDHVEIIDDRNGVLHLKEAYAPFMITALPYYAGHLVCQKAVEAAGGSFTNKAPAECGPYLFDSWEQNQKVTLKANPDWKGEPVAFQTIEFFIVPDDQAALLAYEADSFDFTRIGVSGLRSIKNALPAGAALIEAPSTTYTWLTVNQNAEPLKDLRVRQAIQYAYDSDAVLEGAYDGAVGRSAGVIQPTSPFARARNIIDKRDVAKARELLKEAGAENLTLTLIALNDSTSQTVAQIIQASLAEAGITINIQSTDEAAYWSVGDKTAGDGYKSIELVLMSFAGGIEPTENLVWFLPDQIGVYNWSFFDSAEYADLYHKVQLETDDAKRKEMFNRMEDLMEESGDFVFICFTPYIALHKADLKPVILADGHPDPTRFTKL